MYRRISAGSQRELPLRMLFQPSGGGLFHRACEADTFRGLVAGILDDSSYETADAETRLVHRLRLADDLKLISQIKGYSLAVADQDGQDVINVASDEPFIRSLDRSGIVSLEPRLRARG